MTNNHDIIIDEINRVLSNIYKDMNDYLENIITAPSTINRIFKYYAIGLPSDPTVNERYIMFGGTVVRKYVIEDSLVDIELQKMLRGLRMKENDDREFRADTHTLLHRALKLVRECERYNIDCTPYCDNDELRVLIKTLECCLDNKDSKNIRRLH